MPADSAVEKIDYLEEDPPIRSQRYALLSLVLPHSMVQKRELFYVTEFLKKTCENLEIDTRESLKKICQKLEITEEQTDDFIESFDLYERMKMTKHRINDLLEDFEVFKQQNTDGLDTKFADENSNVTSIAGIKIRGVYGTESEARMRAKTLQRNDPEFNVFLADVGKWLPIAPSIEYQIENEEYLDGQLQQLMEGYKTNLRMKDEFYAQQKREKMEAARREGKQGNIQVAGVETVKQALENSDHQANKESFYRDTGAAEAGPSSSAVDSGASSVVTEAQQVDASSSV